MSSRLASTSCTFCVKSGKLSSMPLFPLAEAWPKVKGPCIRPSGLRRFTSWHRNPGNSYFSTSSTSSSPSGTLGATSDADKVRYRALLSEASIHCADILKKSDFDNQLVALSMPEELRYFFHALRAFNSEIAGVKDNCRGNVVAGDMRLRWWEDVLTKIDDVNYNFSTFKHPVADALFLSCRGYGIPSDMLYRSLDCRRKNLNVTRPKTMDDIEEYAERSYSSLNYMMLQALGIQDDEVNNMASHFGVSSGLTLLIMSIPFHENEIYIPEETAQKFNLTTNMARGVFTSDEDKKKFCDVVFDLSSQSYAHLEKGREIFEAKKSKYPNLKYVASTVVPSKAYLEEFRQKDFNIYNINLQDSKIKYAIQWNLAKLKMFNKL